MCVICTIIHRTVRPLCLHVIGIYSTGKVERTEGISINRLGQKKNRNRRSFAVHFWSKALFNTHHNSLSAQSRIVRYLRKEKSNSLLLKTRDKVREEVNTEYINNPCFSSIKNKLVDSCNGLNLLGVINLAINYVPVTRWTTNSSAPFAPHNQLHELSIYYHHEKLRRIEWWWRLRQN